MTQEIIIEHHPNGGAALLVFLIGTLLAFGWSAIFARSEDETEDETEVELYARPRYRVSDHHGTMPRRRRRS